MTALEDLIDVRREEWLPRDEFEASNLEYLVRDPATRTALEVHHGGSALRGRDVFDTWRAYHDYHRFTKGWQDIWYALGLHPDGRIVELRGAYTANSSRPYVTVNIPGNGDVDSTDAQFDAIHRIRKAMILDGGKADLVWHAERGGTVCPGPVVINRLAQIRAAEAETGGLIVPASAIDPESYLDQLPITVHKSVAPVVGLWRVPDYDGYYIVAADGGVFTYGEVPYRGSVPGNAISHNWELDPVVDFDVAVVDGKVVGYTMVTRRGAVFSFGGAVFHGRIDVIGD